MMLLYFEKRTMFTTQSCTRLKSRKLSWRGKGPLVRLHCLHSTYSVQLSKYLWYPVEKHQNSPKSLIHFSHLICSHFRQSFDTLHWSNSSMSHRISVLPLPKRITPTTSAASKHIKVRNGFWGLGNSFGADRILRPICTESFSFFECGIQTHTSGCG